MEKRVGGQFMAKVLLSGMGRSPLLPKFSITVKTMVGMKQKKIQK